MEMYGSIIGLLIIMIIADNLGRKPSIIVGWLFTSIGAGLMAACKSLIILFAGSFLIGAGVFSTISVIPVYLNEVSVGKFRVIGVCLMYVGWGAS